MHRSWRSTAREVVPERLDRPPDLTMLEEENRYASGESDTSDSVVEVYHGPSLSTSSREDSDADAVEAMGV